MFLFKYQESNFVTHILANKFLVVSGQGEYNSPAQASEVIDLKNENFTCDNFANHPINVSSATGAVLGSKVIVCGGEFIDYDNISEEPSPFHFRTNIIDDCYSINQNEAVLFAKMKEKRTGASSIVYDNKLWITGGMNIRVMLRTCICI